MSPLCLSVALGGAIPVPWGHSWLALTLPSPQTREELREALENEIRSFNVDKVGNI